MSDKSFRSIHFGDLNYIQNTKEESSYFLGAESNEITSPITMDCANFYSNAATDSSSETLPFNETAFNNYIPRNFVYSQSHHKKSATFGTSILQHLTGPKSFQPITSCSYKGYKKSEAVSYLSYFAETTASDLNAISLDGEGAEIGEYVLGQLAGVGANSIVRKAYTTLINKGSDNRLAAKIVKNSNNDDNINKIGNEIQIWKLLEHKNILKYVDSIENEFAVYVFMEYCSKKSLLEMLENKKVLFESEARPMFKQICEAIKYLHEDMRVVHNDIKLENILFDEHMNIKLSDFGFSSFISESDECEELSGTIAYCAPERLKKKKSTASTDVWALGVVLFAMCSGTLPFKDNFEPRLIRNIRMGQYDVPEHFSHPLVDLVSNTLCVDESKRYTIYEIINHEWFKL